MLFSDASMTGWGATDSNCSTGGKWSSYDVGRHINELELLAAFLALQYFANSSRNCSIRLNIDNTTAVAHINKSGGTRSPQLLEIAQEPPNGAKEKLYVRFKIPIRSS